jgi:hypothetical protein
MNSEDWLVYGGKRWGATPAKVIKTGGEALIVLFM